jgi:hypothetical protein
LKGYLVFIALITANLAWLVNPHACCPRMEIGSCPEMFCSMVQPSSDCSASTMADCSDMQDHDFLQLTLSDQFSKGVNNFPAESISAVVFNLYEQNLTFELFQDSAVKIILPGSFIGPPAEKPPAVF